MKENCELWAVLVQQAIVHYLPLFDEYLLSKKKNQMENYAKKKSTPGAKSVIVESGSVLRAQVESDSKSQWTGRPPGIWMEHQQRERETGEVLRLFVICHKRRSTLSVLMGHL